MNEQMNGEFKIRLSVPLLIHYTSYKTIFIQVQYTIT